MDIKKTNRLSSIIVSKAREHNLKEVTIAFPKYSLTVITGPSGSGKSSLAFDVLYEEGRRRYIDSLSAYARQFLGPSKRPLVESIVGLCPAIAIEQKTVSANPRSTVGTVTEIYDYLRVLFARIGKAHCVSCGVLVHAEAPDRIASMVGQQLHDDSIEVLAPVVRNKKGEFNNLLLKLFLSGYYRIRIDGQWYKFTSQEEIEKLALKKTLSHAIEVLIDALEQPQKEQARLQAAIETSFSIAGGLVVIVSHQKEIIYSQDRICIHCQESVPELEPRSFSFNSLLGACQGCQGLGVVYQWDNIKKETHIQNKWFTHVTSCSLCDGRRLNKQALSVFIAEKSIADITQMPIEHAHTFFKNIILDEVDRAIAHTLLFEITSRLEFLMLVGLDYLSLGRSSASLSGGEGQRIRLATQIGSMLSGVLYVLDEPSIGLHQKDNDQLIKVLERLRDLGNTVVVVEHDMDTIAASDYIIDMGPAAGMHGGHVVASGTPKEIEKNPLSVTGQFLSGKKNIEVPLQRRNSNHTLVLSGAQKNNLQNISVSIPLGVMVGVSGVSGSGKSTLIMDELVGALEHVLYKKPEGVFDTAIIKGWEQTIKSLVVIDQSPIGRTSRSNVATYIGVFDDIRKLYASLPESNARGYSVGKFSFNTKEGHCRECKGDGSITFEMSFLPAVTVTCKMCKGKRYNKAVLEITYKGKSIFDCLSMTADEAHAFFINHRLIAKRLGLLIDVGLGYLQLGQASTTFSGGEAQRIKLVQELAKRGDKTMYILDEPTTGLHSIDIIQLLAVLNRLVNKGNSMIIIEHNIDVLKTVDYIIDLGPQGGNKGGMIVAQGRPEEVARHATSFTGYYLKKALK